MATEYKTLETKLVHAGEPEPRIEGAVSLPIFQSANYEYAGETEYDELKYIRLNNTPNHRALHIKLAALENAEAALVTASGMAAITTSLLSILSTGDHILLQDVLYGGTLDLAAKDFAALGIVPEALLQVADLKAVVEFARAHGLVSLIDNTFPSPVNFRPAEHGFDLSLHSGTKYLNGHSDIVAGAVIGRAGLVKQVQRKLNHLGGSLEYGHGFADGRARRCHVLDDQDPVTVYQFFTDQ